MKYTLKLYPELLKKVDSMTVDELLLSVIVPNVNAGEIIPPRDTTAVFVHPTTTEMAKSVAHEINDGREAPALIVFRYGIRRRKCNKRRSIISVNDGGSQDRR